MCIQHQAYYKSCNHTTSFPDINPPPTTYCKIYILTGYCFNPKIETEIFTHALCTECDVKFRFDRNVNVVRKSEGDIKEEKKLARGLEGGLEGGLDRLQKKKEGLVGGDLGVIQEDLKEPISDGRRVGSEYRYREHEYYSSRPHSRRKEKPAFGNWEIIERSELEGYEEFVRAQGNDSKEVVIEDACWMMGGTQKDKKVEGVGGPNGGEISRFREFRIWDRPRIVGLALDGVSSSGL
jgi:hypothetical protein